MKYRINVVLDEFRWSGEILDEYSIDEYGEDEVLLYNDYVDWMNGKAGSLLIDKTESYLKNWNEDVEVEGGSLMYPNGIMFSLVCDFSYEILELVQDTIENNMNNIKKLNAFKMCPIEEIDFKVYIEEE